MSVVALTDPLATYEHAVPELFAVLVLYPRECSSRAKAAASLVSRGKLSTVISPGCGPMPTVE